MAEAHALIQETHQQITCRYRDMANRHKKKKKNQRVEMGILVWERCETTLPGTCKKLSPKWDGVYRVVEVVMDGSVYVMRHLFPGKKVQRAAGQVEPYYGSEEWFIESPSA